MISNERSTQGRAPHPKGAGAGLQGRRYTMAKTTAHRNGMHSAARRGTAQASTGARPERHAYLQKTELRMQGGRNGKAPLPASRFKIQDKAQDKLGVILRAAARVFYERGFEGASIRDISRASGVSLSGLYYYFESKQKLLYLIQKHTFASVVARLEERLAGVRGAEERLRMLIHNHLDYFLEHRIEMKVLSHEDEALEGPYRKEVAALKRRYYEMARDIFEALRASGQARKLNPRVAVLTLFGMMNWVYTWHKPKVDPRAEELARAIGGIFLQGVRNGTHQSERRAQKNAVGNSAFKMHEANHGALPTSHQPLGTRH
jgi:AcrR family transcriptional regulator